MKILITAGPTRENIDPVRFISNRSSGKMGYAIADAAYEFGHEVCLITGPVSLPTPDGIEMVYVESAEDMFYAVEKNLEDSDCLIMAAAVADWTPIECVSHKMKKDDFDGVLKLKRTKDILAELKHLKGDRIFVGFAAETDDLVKNANKKLVSKGLDFIVANDISMEGAGFGCDTNIVTIFYADGVAELPQMPKSKVAEMIIERVVELRV
jgi:phosphopantothenoylcysteine decarboxylase / phosphopantothenate---cysteine ligase